MSLDNTSISPSSSEEDILHLSSPSKPQEGRYEYLGSLEHDSISEDLAELDLDGNPVYHDEDDTFDYPQTEKQFGEVVVVMKHIQKGTLHFFLHLFFIFVTAFVIA